MEQLASWSLITAAVSVVLALAPTHTLRPVRAKVRVAVRSGPVNSRSDLRGRA